MKRRSRTWYAAILAPFLLGAAPLVAAPAEVRIGVSRDNSFSTEKTPAPATNDAATKATLKLISGTIDPNGGPLAVLGDGKIPFNDDDPSSNFFFDAGSNGGRVLVDLGKVTEIASIATYSWHSGTRAAQNYEVFTAEGAAKGFDAAPAAGVALAEAGWTPLGKVDTSGQPPGQHAAVIAPAAAKSLCRCRYVLFDIKKNPLAKEFNDTFFSEIDIVAADGPELERVKMPKQITQVFKSKFGDYTYTLDVTEAPDLQEWAAKNLIPVMDEWYPKIIKMLPVDGVTPAKDITFSIRNTTKMGNLSGMPAFAVGNSVVFNANFMREQLTGEAIGAGVHEIVHVVQFGGEQEGGSEQGKRPPLWITEGVADYIRWFLFEPQSKGAEITASNFEDAQCDRSYRITANFFDWVIKTHEPDLIRKLNVATRNGYSDNLWKKWTGKTMYELNDDWKAFHSKKLGLKDR